MIKAAITLFICLILLSNLINVMALILIIETSTEVCSVSLTKDGTLLDLIESGEGQNHARLVTVFCRKSVVAKQD